MSDNLDKIYQTLDDAFLLLSKRCSYLNFIIPKLLRSNSSFHFLALHMICLLHICFNIFLLILNLNSLKIWNSFKQVARFQSTRIITSKSPPIAMQIFHLLQYPILSNNNYFPFSIMAIFLKGLLRNLNHQNSNRGSLLLGKLANLWYEIDEGINSSFLELLNGLAYDDVADKYYLLLLWKIKSLRATQVWHLSSFN